MIKNKQTYLFELEGVKFLPINKPSYVFNDCILIIKHKFDTCIFSKKSSIHVFQKKKVRYMYQIIFYNNIYIEMSRKISLLSAILMQCD